MAYLLISAVTNDKMRKGQAVLIRDIAQFGDNERLPSYLRLEILDTAADQIRRYLDRIHSYLESQTTGENAGGWRVRLQMDSQLTAVVGVKPLKAGIVEFMEDDHDGNWTATYVDHDRSGDDAWIDFDIAKYQNYGLDQIRADVAIWFKDTLSEDIFPWQQFYFPDNMVDTRVASATTVEAENEDSDGNIPADLISGGSITRAQAEGALVNRLA